MEYDAGEGIDAPAGFVVGGQVDGLWSGASLVLRLEVAGRPVQMHTVNAEGAFVFGERLPPGATFSLAIASQPPQHTCAVQTGSGQVEMADFSALAVTCTSTIAVSVSLSTPLSFMFNHDVSRYRLPVSMLQGAVSAFVDGPPGTSVQLDGSPAEASDLLDPGSAHLR